VITTLPGSRHDTEHRHTHISPIAMGDLQLTALTLTLTLERQHQNPLVATGPYDSVRTTAVYAVWIRR
jgi:hypothetical protein